jgi:hypothetical protein
MLIDNFLAMLADIPPKLAAGWALWMVLGLLLSRWHLKSRSALVYQQNEPWPLPRPKSAVRIPPPPMEPVEPPLDVTPDELANDPFADLERIFEGRAGSHRMPGESPTAPSLLNSAGAPIDDNASPVMGAEPEATHGRA